MISMDFIVIVSTSSKSYMFYNYNDGFGDNEVSASYYVMTLQKTSPTLGEYSYISEVSTVYFMRANDPNQTIVEVRAKLYEQGNLIETLTNVFEGEFSSLYSYRNYEIRLEADYDLNDKQGIKNNKQFTL